MSRQEKLSRFLRQEVAPLLDRPRGTRASAAGVQAVVRAEQIEAAESAWSRHLPSYQHNRGQGAL